MSWLAVNDLIFFQNFHLKCGMRVNFACIICMEILQGGPKKNVLQNLFKIPVLKKR